MTAIEQLRRQEFGTIPDLIRAHAALRPGHPALIQGDRQLDYASLYGLLDRSAAALQRDGVRTGDVVAICATDSIEYGATFLGGLRAGAGIAPLVPSSTAQALAAMLRDCSAKVLFLDEAAATRLAPLGDAASPVRVALDGSAAGTSFAQWLAPAGSTPDPVMIDPQSAFNIIYSSGTTGTPKGIVQSHGMRWSQLRRPEDYDFEEETTWATLVSTPLYSNTTLVSFLPTLAGGGTVVLLPKFEVTRFLSLAQQYRVTHAMLVPVQYQRVMDHPDFDRYDLSSFRMKYSTSAPFPATLKAEVLKRWPGGLTEYYGMTEGGGSCMLLAHEYPDKLHTVGRPMPDHEIRLIDERGTEVPRGQIGEIVGRSPAMMNGYHNQPQKTLDAEWYDSDGNRFIRTGDIGRFDEDGFLILMDRKKDMIISGGFNVYPSDLEAVLAQHDAVAQVAVVGVPSERWGETPISFIVLKPGHVVAADQLCAWANERLGKTQRISAIEIVHELPRSAIGKVLKRELRERYSARAEAP